MIRHAKERAQCGAWAAKVVQCSGPMTQANLCQLHRRFFSWWLANDGGQAVMEARGSSPRTWENHPRLRKWKRDQFVAWLEGLDPEKVAWIRDDGQQGQEGRAG